jgi:hypothetical protein
MILNHIINLFYINMIKVIFIDFKFNSLPNIIFLKLELDIIY